MRIALNTPTGKVGSQVAHELLNRGAQLSVISRHPRSATELSGRGVHVVEGSTEDPQVVGRLIADADAVFWVCPGDYGSTDMRAMYGRCGAALVSALKQHGPRRIVDLSSVGANLAEGTGPVAGLHDVEQQLNLAAADVTHLRPTYFMENYFNSLPGIASAGAVFLAVPADCSIPMIATRDIVPVAVERLLDASWSGQHVIDLLGPADISFGEAARLLGEAIGRELHHVQVSEVQAQEALVGMGISENVAGLFLELQRWLAAGLPGSSARRTPQSTTPTTFAQFAAEVFAPAFRAQGSAQAE